MASPLDDLDPQAPKPPQNFAQLGAAQPTPGTSTMKPGEYGDLAALGAPQQPTGTAGAPKPPTPAAPTATPPAPAAGAFDPNKVWGDLTGQFKTKFGRDMTGQEATALQGYAGYTPGGTINQGMIDKATQGIGSYTGDINNPFGPAATGGSTTPTTPNAQTNDLAQQQLQDILLNGGTDAMNPATLNNPAMAAQRANFERVNDRARGRERLAAAERAAASGTLGSGGFNADLAGAEQAAGDRVASFESQLMTQELTDQRNRVQKALELAVQSGDSQKQRELQDRLGTLDLELRGTLGKGQLNLGLLNALLGDKQAGNALGLGYANLGQRANESLLNAIMGL